MERGETYSRHGSLSRMMAAAALFFFFAMLAPDVFAAYLRNQPLVIVQPDGETIHCFASGDEYYNWLHDKNGYVIIRAEDGYYTYAQLTAGRVVATGLRVNRVAPDAAGLVPNIKPAPHLFKEQLDRALAAKQPERLGNSPTSGAMANLVVFIRFSGEAEFAQNLSTYDDMFNAQTAGASSMYSYYKEVSYNALTISSTYYPTPGVTVVSFQDSNPRAYYQPYNASSNPTGYNGSTERTTREHALLVAAVNAISASVPGAINLDLDNDGNVDSVTFIVKGGPDGWSSLLWPHQWSLYSQTVNINGKRVYNYAFQLETFLTSSGVGVLCHEMFHVLGSPDLYHYSGDGLQPVGSWDIMENDMNPPQHMGAFMKFRYGKWISSIPTITVSGTYTLSPLTSSTNNVYKIASPNSASEYFVMEYRNKSGTFESSLPGSGLLVYRINFSRDGQGNASGPPDEVYVYRPNGTSSGNGNPALAHYAQGTGRTAINDSTNPSSFLSTGAAGGLNISDVGAPGATISFTVTIQTGTTSSLDILWRNQGNGKNVVWFLSGFTRLSSGWPPEAPSVWTLAGAADFNNDGKSDILWRHSQDGRNVLWYMDGVTRSSLAWLDSAPQPWSVRGIADFDNDGKPDILWRNPVNGKNVIWLMDGNSIKLVVNSLPTVSAPWNIEGAGDINGDGKPDILWRNHQNNKFWIWIMDGVAKKSDLPMSDVPAAWYIRGVGDFDKDGQNDILWRNGSNGSNYIWFMSGSTLLNAQKLDTVAPSTGWNIFGVGHFN